MSLKQAKYIPVVHVTANATLTRAQSGTLFTNLGATGAVKLTLPQDAEVGDTFKFSVAAAQTFLVSPGAAGALIVAGDKQADNKGISADDEAECIEVVCIGGGDWIVRNVVGTWTVEA